MSTLARLRHFFVPAIIALLIVIAAGWYNLFWLPSQHKYLDNRNFRTLMTLSGQISTSINTFDKMLDHASDSGITERKLAGYLKVVAPNTLSTLEDSQDKQVIGGDYGDPPNMIVTADEGTHFLYLAFQRKRDKTETKYAVRTDLESLVRRLLPPDNRNPFDVVLVAQSDGTVIFQSSSPGLAVTKIDSFEDEFLAAKTDKPKSADLKGLPQSSRFSSSKFSEISLAGSRYRLYSQPLQLSFPLLHSKSKGAADEITPRPPEQWILCGLESAGAFRAESQSISYTFGLWLAACILLAIAAYPFLKLLVSSPTQRLRSTDIIVMVVSTCVAAATFTFAGLDGYFWQKNFSQPAVDQMGILAASIKKNFVNERKSALKQLKDFYVGGTLSNELREALRNAPRKPQPASEQLPMFSEADGICKPHWACRTKMLEKSPSPAEYPYLQSAFWSDSNGKQWVKWTPKDYVTAFANLDDPSNLYYPAVKRAFEYSGAPHPVSLEGMGSQYSSNTGGNITVFWELLDIDGNPVSEKIDPKNVFCASLVTRPISVVDPVLPAGFEFAIVKDDGTVIFHSDSTRNLRENFFAETDQNQEIRSRVLMRAPGPLIARYMGRGHRLYIAPISANPDEPWTLIIFRDLQVEETMNLEVLSLAFTLFVLYAVVIALALVVTHWTQRGPAGGSWLWPDSRRAGKYRLLVIINIATILVLFALPKLPWLLVLLSLAVCIPAGVLVINLVSLKRQADGSRAADRAIETSSSRWQLGYTGTFATLLVVVAVLPCLSFFKVAWDFEYKLFIERSQLRLIDDFNTRREKVRSSFEGVKLGDYAGRLLSEPEEENPLLFSYHQSFLDTRINSTQEDKRTQPTPCGLAIACDQQRHVESFLGTLHFSYNQIAYDGRYLNEASLDNEAWSPTWSEGDGPLTLTKREPAKKARTTITSVWEPLDVHPDNGFWWLGILAYLAVFFCLVWFCLRRIFLLGLPEPDGGQSPLAVLEPDNLITKLPRNMVVIGLGTSPTIVNLVRRAEVQVCDLYELLSEPLQKATTAGGGSFNVAAPGDPMRDIAQKIVQIDRPVVFQNFERGLDDPDSSRKVFSALEVVLSGLHKTVVITSRVDPLAKSAGDEREQRQTLLQSFARINLDSCPAKREGESVKHFDDRISSLAYYDWLFSGLKEAQKLVLVHLAQERLVNPNSRHLVHELMKDGLIVRPCGMLTIPDGRFADFLRSHVPHASIKQWEGEGTNSDTLRTSLVVLGAALVGFLLYTQGAIWLTYATGLATAVPTIMKLFDVFRRGAAAGSASSLA